MHVERIDGTVAVFRHLGVASRGNLIQAVGAWTTQARADRGVQAICATSSRQLRPWHADQLPGGACGVGQRAEQVEGRSYTEILPGRRRMAHRRMEGRRKEECDSGLLQASFDDCRLGGDVHAEGFEEDPRCRIGSRPSGCRAWPPPRLTPRRQELPPSRR